MYERKNATLEEEKRELLMKTTKITTDRENAEKKIAALERQLNDANDKIVGLEVCSLQCSFHPSSFGPAASARTSDEAIPQAE